MITLIAIRHLEIDGRVIAHGTELKPGLLAKATVDKLLDQGSLKEYDSADRRSLHRLFAPFSGCEEREQLTKDELTELSLPK